MAAVLPQVFGLLNGPYLATRRAAASALGGIGTAAKDAVPALVAALHHPRWLAADRRTAEGGVVTQLMQSLHDRIPGDPRQVLVEALGEIGDDRAVEPLRLLLDVSDEPLLTLRTVQAIAQLGDAGQRAVTDLLKCENVLWCSAAEIALGIETEDEST